MTPFLGWLKRFVEKSFGTWYEGPEPPKRIEDMAIGFANAYPHATREEWAIFAKELARAFYKEGYQRGFEYVERLPIQAHYGKLPPELMTDQVDPDWRWRPVQLVVDKVEPYEPPPEDVNEGLDLDVVFAHQQGGEQEESDDAD